MKIEVTEQAMEWFRNELGAQSGDGIQFYVRYGGYGKIHTGFSLGVVKKEPEDPAVTIKKDDIVFYIEKKDEWYFEGKDFKVDYNTDLDEIDFIHNI